MISENLIKTKGFEDCLVYSNDDSINVIIKKENIKLKLKEDLSKYEI